MAVDKSVRAALGLVILGATPLLFGQTIPAQWHQPLTEQERQFAGRIMTALKRAPDFPRLKACYIYRGAPPEQQINAWEQNMQIHVPVEMFRFLRDDPGAFAFLVAHEAGHAKQEEIYGQSCYTTRRMKMSKFDWIRTLADIAGAAATQGWAGANEALSNVQKQACEDNADAWAVRFLRQAGIDPSGGIRLFNKTFQYSQSPGWKGFLQQFTASHSINPLRVVHIVWLMSQKQEKTNSEATQVTQNADNTQVETHREPSPPSSTIQSKPTPTQSPAEPKISLGDIQKLKRSDVDCMLYNVQTGVWTRDWAARATAARIRELALQDIKQDPQTILPKVLPQKLLDALAEFHRSCPD